MVIFITNMVNGPNVSHAEYIEDIISAVMGHMPKRTILQRHKKREEHYLSPMKRKKSMINNCISSSNNPSSSFD